MYGSYGSYDSLYSSSPSSFSAISSSSPMNISSSGMHSDNTTCAYPSWPRRSALSGCTEQRASSYLSDDDLFPQESHLEEDDAQSVSSSGSSLTSPADAALTEAHLVEMERQRRAMQKEYIKMLASEKERRKSAAKKSRRSSSGSTKKSSSSRRTATMTPIVENGE